MGAIIKNVQLISDLVIVNYSDNGTSDRITKSIPDTQKAIDWLKLWYSDLSGGFMELEGAINELEQRKGAK